MKRLIANAAPWTLALKKMYLADFPPDSLWEVYGSTELGRRHRAGSGGSPAQARVMWAAAPGIEIKLFDDGRAGGHRAVPDRRAVRAVGRRVRHLLQGGGEVRRSAPGGTSTPSATSPTVDEDGYYYIADRKNDMIISGGMNIYPPRSRPPWTPPRTSTRSPCSASPTRNGARACTPWSCRPGRGDRGGRDGVCPGAPGRLQGAEVGQLCWTSCRRPGRARCSSASCGSRIWPAPRVGGTAAPLPGWPRRLLGPSRAAPRLGSRPDGCPGPDGYISIKDA